MSQTARFQETLRRLVIFHKGLVEAGLGRIVSAAPHVATALDYDVESALEEPNDR